MTEKGTDNLTSTLASRFVQTRLAPPLYAVSQIRRPRLLDELNRASRARITIVQAPAGYGKTTLLSQWYKLLKDDGTKVSWLTIEEDDSDPSQFSAYLVAAIKAAGIELVGFDKVAETTLLEASPNETMTGIANNLIAMDEPVVLFFDDYHMVQKTDVRNLMNSLILRAPENVNFVISGRDIPDLKLADLRVHGHLRLLSYEDLRFDASEGKAYFGSGLSTSRLSHAMQTTEGWPVAMYLFRLFLSTGDKEQEKLNKFTGKTRTLVEYFTEQILLDLPADIQSIMMRSAIVSRFNGDLINELSGRDDGWSVLEELELRNLLIVPVNEERQWYRYHPLFKEFLQNRLERLEGAKLPLLHAKLADWFLANGFPLEAVRHAVCVPDPLFAVALVEKAGGVRLVYSDGLKVLRTVCNVIIPRDLLAQYPRTRGSQIYLMMQDKCFDEAWLAFEELREATNDFHIYNQEVLNTDALVDGRMLEMLLAMHKPRPILKTRLDQLEDLLNRMNVRDPVLDAMFSHFSCMIYFWMGDYVKALQVGHDGLVKVKAINALYVEGYLQSFIGMAHLELGQLEDAAQHYQHVLQASGIFGASSRLAAIAQVLLAEVRYEQNDISEARELIDKSLHETEDLEGWVDIYTSGSVTATRIAAYTHGTDKVLQVLDQQNEYAETQKLDYLKVVLLCQRIHHLCVAGQVNEAADLAQDPLFISLLENQDDEGESWRLREPVTIATTRLAFALGDYDKCLKLLTPLYEWSAKSKHTRWLIKVLILQSLVHHRCGRQPEASANLQSALELGAPGGFVRSFVDEGPELAELMNSALDVGQGLTEQISAHRRTILAAFSEQDGLSDKAKKAAEKPAKLLSPRELQVLKMMADGYSGKEIADKLGLTESTVKSYRANLYKKLGVHWRSRALEAARKLDLIS